MTFLSPKPLAMKNRLYLLSQNVGVDVSKDSVDAAFSTMDMQQQVKVKTSS